MEGAFHVLSPGPVSPLRLLTALGLYTTLLVSCQMQLFPVVCKHESEHTCHCSALISLPHASAYKEPGVWAAIHPLVPLWRRPLCLLLCPSGAYSFSKGCADGPFPRPFRMGSPQHLSIHDSSTYHPDLCSQLVWFLCHTHNSWGTGHIFFKLFALPRLE